jgi:hypothetical protein
MQTMKLISAEERAELGRKAGRIPVSHVNGVGHFEMPNRAGILRVTCKREAGQ